MEDSLPENINIGSRIKAESSLCFADFGLPVENVGGALGGTIGPGRIMLLLRVLGVANLEILKVFALGVAPNMDILLSELVGEPLSVTFVGEGGRLAGD